MPKVLFKNINVHYEERGKGRAVVLLHGFLEDHTMWNDYAESLSKSHRVICIDLLGHGKTENLAYVHSMEEMADAVKAVLNHLNLRRVVIIGHSMGGYVALAFADKYPDAMIGLGLFFSTSHADSPSKKAQRLRAMELVKQNHKAFVRTTIPMLFRPKSRTLYRNEISELKKVGLAMKKQSILAAIAGMRQRPDREALLHFAPYKTMIICGKRDTAIPIENMLPQLEAPNVSHQLITENGHMGHIEDRDICLQMIVKFLREV